MSYGGRLRMEREVWRAAWKQIDAFLDQIEGAADQDAPEAQRVAAILPVLSTLERLRSRATGLGLSPALASAPGGPPGVTVSAADIAVPEDVARLPGPEDLELALGYANIVLPGMFVLAPSIEPLQRRNREGVLRTVRVPSYDFGFLTGGEGLDTAIESADEQALFPLEPDDGVDPEEVVGREATVVQGFGAMRKWSALRDSRLAKAEEEAEAITILLDDLLAVPRSDHEGLRAVGDRAETLAAAADHDANVLESSAEALRDAEVLDDAILKVEGVADLLRTSAGHYRAAAALLASPQDLDDAKYAEVQLALAFAANPESALRVLPSIVADAIAELTEELDKSVDARIAYPDGHLRIQRALEWSFRYYWLFRRRWFAMRGVTHLGPLFQRYLSEFATGLNRVVSGQPTGAFGGRGRIQKDLLPFAREVPVTPDPTLDVSRLQSGRIAVVEGTRRTLAVLLGAAPSRDGLLLKMAPIRLSIETDLSVPGLPGLVERNARLTTNAVQIPADALKRGRHPARPVDDAIAESAVALYSKLRLLRGSHVSLPAVPAPPYALESFDVEPVRRSDSQVVVRRLPPASGDPPYPVVRPGEVLLLRGRDEAGTWWQGALEVASAERASAETLLADGRREPSLCPPDEEVLLVAVRTKSLSADLVTDISLRRDFHGFTPAALMIGKVLPPVVTAPGSATDPDALTVGGQEIYRDAELAFAVSVLDEWLTGST